MCPGLAGSHCRVPERSKRCAGAGDCACTWKYVLSLTYITNEVFTRVMVVTWSVLVQTLTTKGPINWRRTLAIATFGFFWAGPSAHYWQSWLQRTFPKKGDVTLAKKVLLHKLLLVLPEQIGVARME